MKSRSRNFAFLLALITCGVASDLQAAIVIPRLSSHIETAGGTTQASA